MFRVDPADALCGAGHDVVPASDIGFARPDDAALLVQAMARQRVLIKLESHFGDRVVLPPGTHCGVRQLPRPANLHRESVRVLVPLLSGRTEARFRQRLVRTSPGRI